jgi:hypothetical protein
MHVIQRELSTKSRLEGSKTQMTAHKSTSFVLVLFAFLACCQLPAYSEVKTGNPKPNSNPVITDLSGRALIDRTLEVTGVIQGNKWLELVEVSTPSTPSSNHARIWLQEVGTKQALKIIFDDGTIVSIAGT